MLLLDCYLYVANFINGRRLVQVKQYAIIII